MEDSAESDGSMDLLHCMLYIQSVLSSDVLLSIYHAIAKNSTEGNVHHSTPVRLHRHTHRTILYGPRSIGGANFRLLHVEQGIL